MTNIENNNILLDKAVSIIDKGRKFYTKSQSLTGELKKELDSNL